MQVEKSKFNKRTWRDVQYFQTVNYMRLQRSLLCRDLCPNKDCKHTSLSCVNQRNVEELYNWDDDEDTAYFKRSSFAF